MNRDCVGGVASQEHRAGFGRHRFALSGIDVAHQVPPSQRTMVPVT